MLILGRVGLGQENWTHVELCAVQKRIDCFTELSLVRSCAPAARDDAGLLDRDPPPDGGGVRLPEADCRAAERGEARPGSRAAVPFSRGPAVAAAVDGGVEAATLETLALRGVVRDDTVLPLD